MRRPGEEWAQLGPCPKLAIATTIVINMRSLEAMDIVNDNALAVTMRTTIVAVVPKVIILVVASTLCSQCVMHPQIPLTTTSRCPWAIASLLVANATTREGLMAS